MSIRDILQERILVLDGAMGTCLQAASLTAADYGGPAYEGCNEHLVLTRPDAIAKVHADYLEAGADIVETDTFGALRHVLAEYGLQEEVSRINAEAVRIARRETDRFQSAEKPRFVAGSMGPGTKSISVTGGIGFDEVLENSREQAAALIEAGVDLLLLETQQDTLNVKAALLGIAEARRKSGREVPTALSVSVEPMGTMLGGQGMEALCVSVEHFDLLALGLNCSTGPDLMTEHLRTLGALSRFPVLCYPNAGLPDEHGRYGEDPETLAAKIARFCDQGWLNIVGGCCGTTPAHIRAIARAVAGRRPRRPPTERRSSLSGLEALQVDECRRPVLVGERTNVIGSRLFRDMVAREGFEEASEIGRRQARHGAQVLDVCLANPDRDEKSDMVRFLDRLSRKVRVPLMIDSTDPGVVEEALKRSPGKAIINSVNLEDGEKRLGMVAPLARRYGAALVVGTIDEDASGGMALTRERKLSVARRAHDLLTGRYGLPPEDLYFDPLVFPAASGDKKYSGSSVETIEGVRLIKRELPRSKTLLGVSNISFGLPPAGREVLNAVFLQLCVEAGLDLAIVNAEKLARFATLADEDRRLAERVLFWDGTGDPVSEFAARFRDAKPTTRSEDRRRLPVEERLARAVVEGSQEGLAEDLEALSAEKSPLEIINGPLMRGMAEVGRLFGENKMIVAEVLQSAEVMKAAVTCLEPRIDRSSAAPRGTVLLATVKGDVHDIGKNLVHIILKNNGFEVVDLGIKVPSEAIVAAVRDRRPDAVGLSGLLVKSAHQMAATADDLSAAGLEVPLLVGGAALSARFTAGTIAPRYRGPVLYAKDAMAGLALTDRLCDPARKAALLDENRRTQSSLSTKAVPETAAVPAPAPRHPATPARAPDVPTPPDTRLHVLADFRLEDIFAWINPAMLYGRHLGLKGRPEELSENGDEKARELLRLVASLQDEVLAKGLMKAKAVLRFFPAQGEGDEVLLYDSPSSSTPLERFSFPRQRSGEALCLADYLLSRSSGRMDSLALFVVTCGEGILELSARWRERGDYLRSHALQALAVESAEAFAELLHERIRSMWGLPDPANATIRDRLQTRYRGRRFSFGYPACPSLEQQKKLFRLLDPERNIGVRLTEGLMMDPEASVSAMVFHHPEARYFSVEDAAVR